MTRIRAAIGGTPYRLGRAIRQLGDPPWKRRERPLRALSRPHLHQTAPNRVRHLAQYAHRMTFLSSVFSTLDAAMGRATAVCRLCSIAPAPALLRTAPRGPRADFRRHL